VRIARLQLFAVRSQMPLEPVALFGKCYGVSEGSVAFCKVGNRSLPSKLVPLDYLQTLEYSVDSREEIYLGKPTDLVQGTLDLLILKTISMEPMNGWAIAKRIVQVSGNVLQVQQGSLYPALHRLEHQGWIRPEWKESENNRRAKYYSLTAAGRKMLKSEVDNWLRLSSAIGLVIEAV
jgi:PadR family transcriptional regulator, regulatory protein PadR